MTVAATAGDQVVHNRGWFIFLSILLIVAGAAAVAFPILSTFAVELWAAIAFAVAGVAQKFTPLPRAAGVASSGSVRWTVVPRGRRGAVAQPPCGVVTLTVFLAAVLVVDGVSAQSCPFKSGRGRGGSGCSWVALSGSCWAS